LIKTERNEPRKTTGVHLSGPRGGNGLLSTPKEFLLSRYLWPALRSRGATDLRRGPLLILLPMHSSMTHEWRTFRGLSARDWTDYVYGLRMYPMHDSSRVVTIGAVATICHAYASLSRSRVSPTCFISDEEAALRASRATRTR